MYLDFSSEKYKNKALNKSYVNYENDLTASSAFLLVLKDLDYNVIDNLCEEVSKGNNITPLEVYNAINTGNCSEEFKEYILSCAYNLIGSSKNMGTKMKGNHNVSSWISHCLFEGKTAYIFANAMNLNPDTAMKLGLLHDIGRKFDHSFKHTIKGYEYLCRLGYEDDALCSLTHSFLSIPINNTLRGNRCANCDSSIDGFYIDDKGNGVFDDKHKKDDITLFLEQYNYNIYDVILNISDLMATSKGIASPYDRLLDIYTRKAPDPKNSPFFKICFINSMNSLLLMITNNNKYNIVYNIKDMKSDEEIEGLLIKTSIRFMNEFYNLIKINQQSNTL